MRGFCTGPAALVWLPPEKQKYSQWTLPAIVPPDVAAVLAAGGAAPAVIVIALFILTVRAITANNVSASSSTPDVEVIGRQWWWEVRYPNGAITANEIHIPVDEPVRLNLRTGDVIHSFWVPRLHGKIDLVPGRTNAIHIDATRAGTYRGQCAEYCGLQHTRMSIRVVAHEPESYSAWTARERAPAPSGLIARHADPNSTTTQYLRICHNA